MLSIVTEFCKLYLSPAGCNIMILIYLVFLDFHVLDTV